MNQNVILKPAAGGARVKRTGPVSLRIPPGAPLGLPRQVSRRLYGDFGRVGVSLEWHDFPAPSPVDWSRRFDPASLALCLNLAGHGTIHWRDQIAHFLPLTAGFYVPGKDRLRAWRQAGEQHRFVTLNLSAPFLRRWLAGCDGALHRQVEGFLREEAGSGPLAEIHRLTLEQEQLIAQFLHPPVFQAACSLWYHSKVIQLMAEFLFERPGPDELFCDRQKRVAQERVEKVIALLRADLTEPPNLARLGQRVGCSPFYLSRTFSAEMGMTIPQFLRKLRMERAAELLNGGRHNVTEAAMEVGYSSLSHFSQAFCQTMGCCPALYPLRTKDRR
jgi:AraC-like DNA-binding protein